MLEAEQQFSQVVGDDLAKLAVAVQRDIGDHRSSTTHIATQALCMTGPRRTARDLRPENMTEVISRSTLVPPRRTLVRVALVVGLFVVVVVALDRLVPGAGQRLSQADPWWLVASLSLEILACSSYALLFQAVFSRAPWLLTVRRGAEIGLAELGAFAILPSGFGGPAVRVWGLRACEMPWRVIVVRSVAQFGIFNLPYVAAAVVLGLGVSLHVLPGHAPVLTALAPSALVVGSLVIAGGAALLARAARPGEPRWRTRVRSWLATVPEGVADLVTCLRRPWSLLGAVGWWAGDCAALWASFQAVGGRPALSVLILAYMLGQLGTTLPLPGGVGGVEPLMLGIFAASHVDIAIAGAAIICYRAIALGVQGTLGAIAFAMLATELRAQPSDRPEVTRG